MIIIEDKEPKKETWTLEKAKQDYRNKHPLDLELKENVIIAYFMKKMP